MVKFNTPISINFLHNKFVLYFIFIIVVCNLFQLIMQKEFLVCSIFVLTGILTSFFSKNMVVIMVVSVIVANLFKYGSRLRIEGFENDEDEEKKETFEDEKEEEAFEEGGDAGYRSD
jgi:uncharacterized membrane protein YphA (DoxX/SURF4 family)